MTIEHATHHDEEKRREIIATYPEHERDARASGVAHYGSGLVFPVADETIAVDAFALPPHFYRINGLDFGWDHPFAAVSLAWDKDTDTIYVTASYHVREQTPVTHAAAIRPWGEWIPCAWPHDGLAHDKGSGDRLSSLYAGQGLTMLPEHASHEEGGFGLEAGVIEMLERMQTGRFKVFRHLDDWFAEKRLYHREGGLIIKERDDILSATRIAMMMKRFAIIQPTKKPRMYGAAHAGAWMA